MRKKIFEDINSVDHIFVRFWIVNFWFIPSCYRHTFVKI